MKCIYVGQNLEYERKKLTNLDFTQFPQNEQNNDRKC